MKQTLQKHFFTQEPGRSSHPGAVEGSGMSALHILPANATKNIAACAGGTRAKGRFGWKTLSLQRWLFGLSLLLLVGALWGCAAPGGSGAGLPDSGAASPAIVPKVTAGVAPIPGGYWMYSYGPGQTRENFANVAFAQFDYALWPGPHWGAMGPGNRATATRLGLQAYYPLHVRWKLKDGREFILENIDTAAIMREYFKTHQLQLQWQREGRPEARIGDSEPLLAHEVKDDTVILKWVITFNLTPVAERLTSTGAATKWEFRQEEHIVAILPGQPTSGIDFKKN